MVAIDMESFAGVIRFASLLMKMIWTASILVIRVAVGKNFGTNRIYSQEDNLYLRSEIICNRSHCSKATLNFTATPNRMSLQYHKN